METKICSKCKKNKTLSEFYKVKQKKDGYDSTCKKCRRAQHLKYVYGNGASEYYKTKFDEQNGCCEICGRPEKGNNGRALNFDHNHKTGQWRGLLCNSCNHQLSKFENHTNYYKKFFRYLEKYSLTNI